MYHIATLTILNSTYHLNVIILVNQLTACLLELKTTWLTNNFLHLNNDKTQVVLFGSTKLTLAQLICQVHDTKNLDFILGCFYTF